MPVACTHRLSGSQGAAEVGSEVALSCSAHIAWHTGIYSEIAGHTCSALPGLSGANTKYQESQMAWHPSPPLCSCSSILYSVLFSRPTGPSTALFCPPVFSSLVSPFSPDQSQKSRPQHEETLGWDDACSPCSPHKSLEEFPSSSPTGALAILSFRV